MTPVTENNRFLWRSIQTIHLPGYRPSNMNLTQRFLLSMASCLLILPLYLHAESNNLEINTGQVANLEAEGAGTTGIGPVTTSHGTLPSHYPGNLPRLKGATPSGAASPTTFNLTPSISPAAGTSNIASGRLSSQVQGNVIAP